MSDLLDEFFSCTPLRQSEMDAFADRGVPPMALVQPDALCRDMVVFDGAGRFEFKRWSDPFGDAMPAIIIMVRSGAGFPMDLAAWTPSSTRVATWLGYAGLLGEDGASAPRLAEGLRVHRSPLTWLQCSRRGVVIADPRRAAAILRVAGPIEAEDLGHARELRAMLAEPPIRITMGAGIAA